jgi:hypothetical protein
MKVKVISDTASRTGTIQITRRTMYPNTTGPPRQLRRSTNDTTT